MKTVLDSASFINTSLLNIENAFTTPEVIDEIKDLKSKCLVESARESGDLGIRSADEKFLKQVKEKANEIGSLEKLSNADISIVALALELKAVLKTDDYTVQNIAKHLGIEFKGIMRGEIKKKKTFKK